MCVGVRACLCGGDFRFLFVLSKYCMKYESKLHENMNAFDQRCASIGPHED